MATLTPLLSLVKPAGSDAAAISVLNGNMDTLDNAATLTGSQTLTGKTLTSPHMTTAVVDAGGLTITSGGETITAGGLTVTAGNVGIGTAAADYGMLQLSGALTSSQQTQYGIIAQPVTSSNGTTESVAVWARAGTAAVAFTVTTAADFHAGNPLKGAGSTITSAYGLLVDSITSGNTNNYGIYVGAPSGGSVANIGIYNNGSTVLAGVGGIQMLNVAAFSAGSKYLTIDAGGILRISALGPAS